jgi:hypothetical protein
MEKDQQKIQGIKDRSGKAGTQRWDVGGESPTWNTGFEFIQLGEA